MHLLIIKEALNTCKIQAAIPRLAGDYVPAGIWIIAMWIKGAVENRCLVGILSLAIIHTLPVSLITISWPNIIFYPWILMTRYLIEVPLACNTKVWVIVIRSIKKSRRRRISLRRLSTKTEPKQSSLRSWKRYPKRKKRKTLKRVCQSVTGLISPKLTR